MQGFDQNLIKIWKYNLMGSPEGWVEKVRTKEFGDKIGLGFGDTRRGVDMGGWGDGGVERWYRLPLTARDPSIYGQDLNSISFGLPGSGNPAEWYFQSGHSYTPGGGLKTPHHWTQRPSSNVLFVVCLSVSSRATFCQSLKQWIIKEGTI